MRKPTRTTPATKAKDKSGVNRPVKAEKVPKRVAKDEYSRPTQKQKL